MAKKIYHIPTQKVENYLAEHKGTILSSIKNSNKLELYKRFGKAFYIAEIEHFIKFLKIDKEPSNALKLVSYLESKNFLTELTTLMKLSTFLEPKREYFYVTLYHLYQYDNELFSNFLQHSFLHFSTTITLTKKN